MLVYLVHLLDFEWQEYDHTLLNELQLPEFFYTCSVSKLNDCPFFSWSETFVVKPSPWLSLSYENDFIIQTVLFFLFLPTPYPFHKTLLG